MLAVLYIKLPIIVLRVIGSEFPCPAVVPGQPHVITTVLSVFSYFFFANYSFHCVFCVFPETMVFFFCSSADFSNAPASRTRGFCETFSAGNTQYGLP